MQKQSSAPIIISVENSSANDIDNVVMLDPAAQIQYAGAGSSYGNDVAIAITCPDNNVTYPEVLYEISNKPLIVDKLYIIGGRTSAIVPAPSPITLPFITMQPLSLVKYNAKGILKTKIIAPIRDVYQKIAAIALYEEGFSLDEGSRIIIPRMYARTKIIYYIYIKLNVDISRLFEQEKNIVAEFEKEDIFNMKKVLIVK